jgi:hypothetical protein
MLLSDDEQDTFVRLLTKIADERGEPASDHGLLGESVESGGEDG